MVFAWGLSINPSTSPSHLWTCHCHVPAAVVPLDFSDSYAGPDAQPFLEFEPVLYVALHGHVVLFDFEGKMRLLSPHREVETTKFDMEKCASFVLLLAEANDVKGEARLTVR